MDCRDRDERGAERVEPSVGPSLFDIRDDLFPDPL